jgi:small subunit ribosomal protein S3
MGQKVNPKGFRLALTRDWDSRWYANKKQFPVFVAQDHKIRTFLEGRLRYASVPRIFIERSTNDRVRVRVYTARPGVVIGRKGQELDKLRADLAKQLGYDVILDIHEIKKPDLEAKLVSENVALQLERRFPFRRAMKKALQSTMSLGAQGIKIQCSGRLNGMDIARSERQRAGRVPLQTLRENIDYGFTEARTTYGLIGVKCWICKPEEE